MSATPVTTRVGDQDFPEVIIEPVRPELGRERTLHMARIVVVYLGAVLCGICLLITAAYLMASYTDSAINTETIADNMIYIGIGVSFVVVGFLPFVLCGLYCRLRNRDRTLKSAVLVARPQEAAVANSETGVPLSPLPPRGHILQMQIPETEQFTRVSSFPRTDPI